MCPRTLQDFVGQELLSGHPSKGGRRIKTRRQMVLCESLRSVGFTFPSFYVTFGSYLTMFQALGLILEQLAPAIYSEDNFIADFLQINNTSLTFADYVGLDNYFRRQATRAAGLSQS